MSVRELQDLLVSHFTSDASSVSEDDRTEYIEVVRETQSREEHVEICTGESVSASSVDIR